MEKPTKKDEIRMKKALKRIDSWRGYVARGYVQSTVVPDFLLVEAERLANYLCRISNMVPYPRIFSGTWNLSLSYGAHYGVLHKVGLTELELFIHNMAGTVEIFTTSDAHPDHRVDSDSIGSEQLFEKIRQILEL